MRVIRLNREEGEMKLEPQSLEDLWFLTKLLEVGDVVEGRSFRIWKPKGVERAGVAERKPIKVRLQLDNIDFAQAANKLRLTGVILAGEPEEFCPRGEHHTLDVLPENVIEIKKEFNAYHESVLDEAKKRSKHLRVVILVIDEEKAMLAELETKGIAFGAEFRNHANKRDPNSFEEKQKKYMTEVLDALIRKSEGGAKVVIAGPGFAHSNLKKLIDASKPELAKRCHYEHASSAEKTAVYELFKNGVLEKLLGEQKLQEEFAALEKFKAGLGKNDGKTVYGIDKVQAAVQARSVEELLVTDELVRKSKPAREALDEAKAGGAKITIFNSEDDAGLEFKSFKIAALLRYRVEWE